MDDPDTGPRRDNRLDLGVSYLERLDGERFDSLAFSETRMGLLYDRRFFSFGEAPLTWESLIELPLGMLTSGSALSTQEYRQALTAQASAGTPVAQAVTTAARRA